MAAADAAVTASGPREANCLESSWMACAASSAETPGRLMSLPRSIDSCRTAAICSPVSDSCAWSTARPRVKSAPIVNVDAIAPRAPAPASRLPNRPERPAAPTMPVCTSRRSRSNCWLVRVTDVEITRSCFRNESWMRRSRRDSDVDTLDVNSRFCRVMTLVTADVLRDRIDPVVRTMPVAIDTKPFSSRPMVSSAKRVIWTRCWAASRAATSWRLPARCASIAPRLPDSRRFWRSIWRSRSSLIRSETLSRWICWEALRFSDAALLIAAIWVSTASVSFTIWAVNATVALSPSVVNRV